MALFRGIKPSAIFGRHPRVLFLTLYTFRFTLPRSSQVSAQGLFPALTAVRGFDLQLYTHILSCFIPLPPLFNQILQSNSPIHTIATLTTQYSPFLFTGIQTIAHMFAFFPAPLHPPPTPLPPDKTPTALGSKYPKN